MTEQQIKECREAFEKWAAQHFQISIAMHGSEYESKAVEYAWHGWSAAQAQQQPAHQLTHLQLSNLLPNEVYWGDPIYPEIVLHILDAAPKHAQPAPQPVGYLPKYELGRLESGHDANLRSAKFGPSPLDGDVPVYTEQPLTTHERIELYELRNAIAQQEQPAPQRHELAKYLAQRIKEPTDWEDIDILLRHFSAQQEQPADAQDAARYRWLRDHHPQSEVCGTDEREDFDAMVDKAMREHAAPGDRNG